MIGAPWPNLTLYADPAGEIDPYDQTNAPLFRGEEAFAPEVMGWRRWSKPSPEPRLDTIFEKLLLDSIAREKAAVTGMVEALAGKVTASLSSPPLLIAILRAGVPVGALLARSLERRLGGPVPLAALSLFDGLGWDAAALSAALSDHPGRPVVFVDGWTSGGGVARELRRSYERWISADHPDFTHGEGPRLAVLCDPRGVAHFSAVQADRFVPSSLFTAPETLGFSRGFAAANGGMFRVYRFPNHLLRSSYVEAWMTEGETVAEAPDDAPDPPPPSPPPGWRLHVNEVVRALINRSPREVLLRESEADATQTLAPVLHLCRLRGVPVSYDRQEVAAWGAVAAARMQD